MSNISETSPSFYALIIGIGTYKDARIQPLEFAGADARGLYELIVDPNHAGFPEDNVKLLIDEEASLYNIKRHISGWLFKHATDDSTVIIFFAGHGGIESDKTNRETDGIAKYLLPWDADPDNLFASALSNLDFQELLRTIKAERLVGFLDACYAAGVSQRGARDMHIVGDPYTAISQGKGRLIIASAQPNQRSWESKDLGHGIFTHHLLEAMKGKADTNNDGLISALNIFQYLKDAVPKTTRQLSNSVQEPMLSGEASNEIIVSINRGRFQQIESEKKTREKQHQEKIRSQRHMLFKMHDKGELPLDVYNEALRLLETTLDELSAKETELVDYLNLLLEEKLPIALYLKSRNALVNSSHPEIVARGEPGKPEPNELKIETGPTTAVKRPAVAFCHHCGAKLIAGNRFCTNCGQRIKV
jgi:hypothetical protein